MEKMFSTCSPCDGRRVDKMAGMKEKFCDYLRMFYAKI